VTSSPTRASGPGRATGALLGALERQAAMMEQEMYVRPEGWLTVARPLVKMYRALGDAVVARKWAVCAASYARAATGTDGWLGGCGQGPRTEAMVGCQCFGA